MKRTLSFSRTDFISSQFTSSIESTRGVPVMSEQSVSFFSVIEKSQEFTGASVRAAFSGIRRKK